MMPYIYLGISLLILWVLNIIISLPTRRRYGVDSEYFKKCVSNGNSIFVCFIGLIGIAVSANLFDFLKWIVIAYFGFFSLFSLGLIIISIVTTLMLQYKRDNVNYTDWSLIGSNLIAMLGDSIIAVSAFYMLF